MFGNYITEKVLHGFLQALEKIEYGSLHLSLPGKGVQVFKGSQPGPEADLTIHDPVVFTHLLSRGDVAFAEDYQAGLWDSSNIPALIEGSIRNHQAMHRYINGNRLQQWLFKLSYVFRANTKKGSKQNILSHYDIGNDFYQLWLDESMTYSSALFLSDDDSLTEAQHHKYDRILQQFPSSPSHLLEIGCGWGGFAERTMTASAHSLYGITISDAQFAYAQERLAPYSDRAEIALTDYRDLEGTYDGIVSIEMFEAVGEKYWPTYFSAIRSHLKPEGTAVIQTITINDEHFQQYRQTGDAIRSFIFPGGMLPSPTVFCQAAQQQGLQSTTPFFFGLSYAKTLLHWLDRFDAIRSRLLERGMDEQFIRLWRFYLAYCAGGFQSGHINVMQINLQHEHRS